MSIDPVTGLMTWHSYDPHTDETIISYSADSTPIIEANKKIANDSEITKQGIKQEWWLYASIPVELQMKWLIEEGLDIYSREHTQRLLKKLADPEYQYLKCTYGKHL